MGDIKNFYQSLRILEACSRDNDFHEFIDRETRLNILKQGPKAGPQLIVKCLMNVITDDILGSSSPRCSYPQNGECNIAEITLSTLKALSYYGLKDVNWIIPYAEAASCKLLENNKKPVAQENENIVVEYVNRPPVKNVNPRSLLRNNQALKRKFN
ncbi:uncharacterized protein [Halyomorpha halys]|uniref:uncharacterized protein isoform X2 n=1 Tax=Halyomorpha halys TaxID=286706 RepID=UPI0006D4FDCC|nr:uncharacterized protein LOC106681915 isoform X2 [Halyomorpha halys]